MALVAFKPLPRATRHHNATPRHATRHHRKSKTRCTYTAFAHDPFTLGPMTHPFAILLLHILPLSSLSFSLLPLTRLPLPSLKVAVLEDLADRIESGKVAVDGMDWNDVFLGALER